jgi:hypothetical protein
LRTDSGAGKRERVVPSDVAALRVVPGRAAEVVEGEVELVGGELAAGEAGDAVVADEGFEFAAEVVALDPIRGEKVNISRYLGYGDKLGRGSYQLTM